jgi:hypothetical protein
VIQAHIEQQAQIIAKLIFIRAGHKKKRYSLKQSAEFILLDTGTQR